MKTTTIMTLLAISSLIVGGTRVSAEDTMVSQAWEGHKTGDHCFALSFPVDERHGSASESYLTVTNRFRDKIQDEVGFVSGFAGEQSVEGSLRIDGGKPIQLLVFQGTGYLKSTSLERDVVRQMRSGKELSVEWSSDDGPDVTDRFSLFGFTKANNFAKECR